MNALIDTNILLDVLLAREPWITESKAVWDASDAARFGGCISAISVPNVFYIARKIAGLSKAHASIAILLEAFDVLPVDTSTLEAAVVLPGNDFEDNIQIASALRAGISRIVTRNPRDFAHPNCPPISPANFLTLLAQT